MINILKSKEKTYKFGLDGLNKAILDSKQEKVDKIVNIGFWGIIASLYILGNINSSKVMSMVACTGTSKIVKYIIR